tara:strand:- start:91 stop:2319 length:2229 start_codon:yes stop_codon:yes gene_type:complete
MSSQPIFETARASDFASALASATARRLFDAIWNGTIEIRHDYDEPDDPDFDSNLPADVSSPACKLPEAVPRTPMAESMEAAEIAASIRDGVDPWAQSSPDEGSSWRRGNPTPSLIVSAFAMAQIVESEEQLKALFRSGQITHFCCHSLAFLHVMEQILPNVISYWRRLLPTSDTEPLEGIAFGADAGTAGKSARQKLSPLDAKIERSLSLGASVLLVTTAETQLSAATRALVTRRVDWRGPTSDIVIETLRLTHSTTGQLAETDIRNRLPSEPLLKRVTPAQIDAAFAASTTLNVADRLAEIARKMTQGQPDLTLDAVHGVGEVRTYLNRVLNDLNAWRTGDLAWAEVTSSAVLYGPPGTGKTTLANAFAGSAGIPIISTSYADCQKHGHQGDMLRALDEAFATAKEAAPAVLFIDELDSFTQRDTPEYNSSYMRGVVNGLLEQINRAKDVEGLVLLGATNSLESVDPAVIRSGRFDLKLHLPLPDKKGLEAILTAKLGSETAIRLDLANLAARLLGQSGAVAEAIVRDALGRAREDRTTIRQNHLESAADQIVPKLDQEILRRTAIHEAGHVVAMTQLGWPLPKRVCLTGEGGKVEHEPFNFLTPCKARERLVVLLAGRAAEICVLGAPSSGAGIGEKSDLAKATSVAMFIERQWGFGETGLLWDGEAATNIWSVPGYVRRRAEQHLMEAERNALALMKEHKAQLITLAKHLLRVRDMTAHDVELFNYYHASQGSERMSLR